jgi:hypothetical protein
VRTAQGRVYRGCCPNNPGILIDFEFSYQEVKDLYGANGNVSVPPAIILKLMLLLKPTRRVAAMESKIGNSSINLSSHLSALFMIVALMIAPHEVWHQGTLCMAWHES